MSRTAQIIILILVAVAVVAVLLAIFLPRRRSSGDIPATPQPPVTLPGNVIEGQDWQLVSLGAAPAVPGSEATMLLENGRATGTTGCNRYNGTYELGAKGALRFGPIAMTQMACQGLMEQEQAFGKALAATTSYSTSQGTLNLLDASAAVVATFKPRPATALAGTNWFADGINNGKQAVVSIAAGSQVTAVFGAGGKLTGSAGCNNYSATYTVDGDKLAITAPAATKKMCPDPAVMEQENAYLKALSQVATFRIDGDRLDLRSVDGARQVSYTAHAPAVAPAPPPTVPIETPAPSPTPTVEPPTPSPTMSAETPLPSPTAPVQPPTLVPSAWELSTVGGQPAVAGSDVFISFEQSGKVNGSTGCNVFNGTYESPQGGVVTISVLMTTKRACIRDLAGQEQAFLQALSDTQGFSVLEGTLSLTDASGKEVATFTGRKSS